MLKEFGEIMDIPKDETEFALLLQKNIEEYLLYLEFNILKNILKDTKYYVYDYDGSQIMVALPRFFQDKEKIKNYHFDLIIVDEAHQFYNAGMVQDILEIIKPDHQLLLTGTPSNFISKIENYNIIPISLSYLYNNKYVGNAKIKIAKSSYKYSLDNYTESFYVKEKTKLTIKETKNTLDSLLEEIVYNVGNTGKRSWKKAFDNMGKTLIVCYRQKRAKQVQDYFNKKGVKSCLSTTTYDQESKEIEIFKVLKKEEWLHSINTWKITTDLNDKRFISIDLSYLLSYIINYVDSV